MNAQTASAELVGRNVQSLPHDKKLKISSPVVGATFAFEVDDATIHNTGFIVFRCFLTPNDHTTAVCTTKQQ